MNEKTEKSNEKSLAIAKDLVGQVLTPADFSALDGLVQKLGERSTSLTDSEKAAAMEVVSEWDMTVTSRIDANARLAKDVLSFLSGSPMHGSAMDRYINMFHDVMGDTDEYDAYQKALEEYHDVLAAAPIEQPASPEMTVAEADRLAMSNRAAETAHGRKRDAAAFAVMRAAKAYVTNLRSMPAVQEATEKLKAYSRKASRMSAECHDKASRIKINIAISDKETRDLLHDLLDFSKGL